MPGTNDPSLWAEIASQIAAEVGPPPPVGTPRQVSGGCIHRAFQFGSSPSYFVKVNVSHFADSFSAESDALEAIYVTETIPVPRPITTGTRGSHAFLVLEFIELRPLSTESGARLGSLLAELHRHSSSDGNFGWHRDNTIGATEQRNHRTRNWADFFCEHRLGLQFKLAADSGVRFVKTTIFLERIHALLSDHHPTPSLLHGDLWGGNAAADPNANPVIFDPATYFGDRETDIAFTHMFGGFGSQFYAAYEAEWPLPDGSAERAEIYNLYHVLNHHHLFGGGYGEQARRLIERYV